MLYIKENEIVRLLRLSLKHWKLFVLSFIGCFALAGMYLLIKNKQWNVTTSVAISDTAGASSSMAGMMAKSAGFGDLLGIGGSVVDNEIVIMKSHTVLYEAVKELGLNVMYTNRPKLKRKVYFQDSPLELISDSPIMGDTLNMGLTFKIKVSADGKRAEIYGKTAKRKTFVDIEADLPAHFDTDWGSFTLRTTEFYEPGETMRMKIMYGSYSATAQSLLEDLEYDLIDKKANVISISLKDINPTKTKALLNTIVKKYETYSLQAKNYQTEFTMNYLQRRIDSVSKELTDLEYAIENYKQNNKLSDLDAEMEVTIKQASSLREQQVAVETQYEIISQLEDYVKNPTNNYEPIPLNLGVEAAGATSALSEYNTLIQEYKHLILTTKGNNPSLNALKLQIDVARQGVVSTIESVKHGIDFTRRQINDQIATFESKVKSMPRQEREFIDLKRQQEIKQQVFVMLLAQQEQNMVNLIADAPKAQLVDKAYVYALPVAPKPKLILAIAFVFALFLPIVWLKFTSMMRKTIHDPEELKSIEGIREIHCMTGTEEDMRRLRSDILDHLERCNGKIITCFSMQNDEQRTVTAMAIAESIAATGHKVALINANLHPDAEREPLPTSDRVTVMTPDFTPDMLESKQFRNTIEQLKQTEDIIVIETAPFVFYPDAIPMLKYSDLQLVMTKRDVTLKKNLPYIESLIAMGYVQNLITIINE